MERDVGIDGYLTSTPGLGGTIKASADDFVVDEISSPPTPAIDGRYTIVALRVRNWETNRLVRELARALHISRRRIGFAGTKDKRALTTQLFSFENVPPETIKALRMKDVEVLDVFHTQALDHLRRDILEGEELRREGALVLGPRESDPAAADVQSPRQFPHQAVRLPVANAERSDRIPSIDRRRRR